MLPVLYIFGWLCLHQSQSVVVFPGQGLNTKVFPAEKFPENLEDLISLIERENLAPNGQKPVEYASYIWNGNWSSADVKNVDGEEDKQLTGEEVRKNLAKIILAAKRKKQNQEVNITNIDDDVTLEDLFPDANIRIGGDSPLLIKQSSDTTDEETTTAEVTTTSQATTTIQVTTTEEPTTAAPTTTTENPANFPKTGDIEVVVEDIVFSGHMLHWSQEQEYLAISDIWGQKYLRFEEIPPATTTPTPTTTNSPTTSAPTTVSFRQAVTGSETTTTTPTDTTTTEVLTTTAEPLPYKIQTLRVPTDTVYLIQPKGRTEGTYPLMIPVHDAFNYTDTTNEMIIAYNERIHLAHWDMQAQEM